MGITLSAFWFACLVARDRKWILHARRKPLLVMLFTGVMVTLAFEWLATGPLDRWRYSEAMPVVPVAGVGLTPLLQWVLLPPVLVWLSRRHQIGSATLTAQRTGGRFAQPANLDS